MYGNTEFQQVLGSSGGRPSYLYPSLDDEVQMGSAAIAVLSGVRAYKTTGLGCVIVTTLPHLTLVVCMYVPRILCSECSKRTYQENVRASKQVVIASIADWRLHRPWF